MKFSKLLLAAVFAFVMTAGALMAADEPLEIHGGGRIGFTVNSMGGSNNGSVVDNRMGRYPNHGETNYYSLWFSKKSTADSGAWSKVTFGIDNWNDSPNGDLSAVEWRLRGFNVEFGALDFLPAGSTLKAGLFGLSQGWNDAQDFGPGPNFSGIGIGMTNLGGMVGIYYMAQDSTSDGGGQGNADNNQGLKLGERTMHAFVATVNNPMVDVIAGFGYAKKADVSGEKNLTAAAFGAVVKLPMGLNVFGQMGLNNWAIQMEDAYADDTVLKGCSFKPGTVDQSKKYKATLAKVGFYGVFDLADGMYVAPAMFYQYFKTGKDFAGNAAWGNAMVNTPDSATNKMFATVKLSKALTQNIAFAPALGYRRIWNKDAADDKAIQNIQVTAGVEMGLNTGYWAGQKVQVYVSYVNVDKDHKKTDDTAWDGKANRVFAGTYVTFGF